MSSVAESDLFAPLEAYLESQGYRVQGEVDHCDLVARRDDEPPVVVELKVRLNLELILQATERFSLTDAVYIAFPSSAALWRRHWRRVRKLCRRLGVGLITLDGDELLVNVRLDPAPYSPRQSKVRGRRLLAEFEHRVGNANTGGVTRTKLVTAYRQDALRLVIALREGPLALKELRQRTGVERAASILQKDHFGWFERVERGVYELSPKGTLAPAEFADAVAKLTTQ